MVIFLDFKRAFETIDSNILLEKLFKYGIQDKKLTWFESYLTNRRQYTNVNNTISDPERFSNTTGLCVGNSSFQHIY